MEYNENKPLQRSIDSLQKIYQLIVALAIGETFKSIVVDKSQWLSEIANTVPIWFSFILILVPFYHGMNRHLDLTVEEVGASRDVSTKIRMQLLLDFVFFMLESMLFLVFAFTVSRRGIEPFEVLAAILIVDIVWGFLAYLIARAETWVWALINAVTLVIGFFLYVFKDAMTVDVIWPLCLVAFLRTLADYWFMRRYYFPSLSKS
jgi:hypothetical protein